MGVNASIEGSNPSFSALSRGFAALVRFTGETRFPPWAPSSPLCAAGGGLPPAGLSPAPAAGVWRSSVPVAFPRPGEDRQLGCANNELAGSPLTPATRNPSAATGGGFLFLGGR